MRFTSRFRRFFALAALAALGFPGAVAAETPKGQAKPKSARATAAVPPFPYHYVGRIAEQDGKVTVFLERGDEMYAASPGGTLANAYRVESIGAEHLDLTYLPLNAPVRLRFADILLPAQQQAGYAGPRAVPGAALPQTPGTPAKAKGVDPYSSEPMPEAAVPGDADAVPPAAVAPPIPDRSRH